MNIAELKTQLQELRDLKEKSDLLNYSLKILEDANTIKAEVNNRMKEALRNNRVNLVFPKMIINGIEDDLSSNTENKEKRASVLSEGKTFIDLSNKDIYGKKVNTNNNIQRKTDDLLLNSIIIKNIDVNVSESFSDSDLQLLKYEVMNSFLELEENDKKIKEFFYSKIKEITDEVKGEVEISIKETKQQIDNINKKISSFDLVHEKYIHLIPKIIDILDEKRSESLTDALNLAIQEEKEEKFMSEKLKIERQKLEELQRQNDIAEEEATARNEILENDLWEQRQIMQEQADAAKRQAQAAERQAEEVERANEEAERREEERQRKLNEASRKYESAARRAAFASGRDKAWIEAEKESAYAEMQKYK